MDPITAEQVTETVKLSAISLIGILGVPAILYFVGQQFVASQTANGIALGTAIVIAVGTIYALFRRQ